MKKRATLLWSCVFACEIALFLPAPAFSLPFWLDSPTRSNSNDPASDLFTRPTKIPTLAPIPTATISPTFSISPSPTYSVTPVPTLTSTGSFSSSPTPSFTYTRTPSGTLLPTLTVTPTFSNSPTPSFSRTTSPTPTNSATLTATPTFTEFLSNTATPTLTPTPTDSSTASVTLTSTDTPVVSSTPTPTDTPTHTASMTPSNSKTPSPTPTVTLTVTPTPTRTPTPVISATSTVTLTPVISATSTASPSRTATPSPAVTFTLTASATPSGTKTPSPKPTSTLTATPTTGTTSCFNGGCTISLVAGVGTYSALLNDGSPATSASIDQPMGACADGAGNVFIGETYRGMVRKVNAGGIVSSLAGKPNDWGPDGDGGPSTAARVGQPHALRLDGAGNLYFSDGLGSTVRKISAGGVISAVAGIANQSGYTGDGGQGASAKLNSPGGVALDGSGNLYIADSGNNCVRKVILATGVISTFAGTGTAGSTGDGGQAASALLSGPQGVHCDGNTLFIADTLNNKIRAVDLSSGIIGTLAGTGVAGAGGDNGPAASAQFNQPYAVATDACGAIYVADANNNKIRRISGGVITTLAGTGAGAFSGDGGAASACALNGPQDIFVNPLGNMYVADRYNSRIRKIAGCGAVTTPTYTPFVTSTPTRTITQTSTRTPVVSSTPTPTITMTPAVTNTPTLVTVTDDFTDGNYTANPAWTVQGAWSVSGGILIPNGADSCNAIVGPSFCDFQYEADVQFTNATYKKAGLIFRVSNMTGTGGAFKGYFTALEIATDRVRLQLWRMDSGAWVYVSEAMYGGQSVATAMLGSPTWVHMKVVCVGPNISVFAGSDMSRPLISEYDATYACGQVGVKNDMGPAQFDNISAKNQIDNAASLPRVVNTDWSGVKGVVFYPSYAMNSPQLWQEYDPVVIDRELYYAKTLYGINTISVYLNWILWDWDKTTFLARFEDFLQRCDNYGMKVFPIFFDDCGNVEPALAPYGSPIVGVHNSKLMQCPSNTIRSTYTTDPVQKAKLMNYVQDVVNAHKEDPRILFWEVYNEPIHDDPSGLMSGTPNLVRDGYAWVTSTATSKPVISTAAGFLGSKYSDFPTYHYYLINTPPCQSIPLGHGGPEHLCTETMDRVNFDVPCVVSQFNTSHNGFVIWELMIARTQTRFPWTCNYGSPCNNVAQEPTDPFHGLVYPDGHPWDEGDVQAMLGTADLSGLPVFDVFYYGDTTLTTLKKTSITPMINFDLPDEQGNGSPDASAGILKDNYSIRWTGKVLPPQTGAYTFYADADDNARIVVNGVQLLNKTDQVRAEVSGSTATLTGGVKYDITVEYKHFTGPTSMHVSWSGPGVTKQVLPGRRN